MLTLSRPIRIEWGHCDPAGIVYYPRYFEMFDASTTLLFERAMGMKKREAYGRFGFSGHPLVAARGRFLRPLSFGDDVVLESAVTEVKRSSVQILHKLIKDGDIAVEGYDTRVWVAPDPAAPGGFKAHPLPAEIAARLTQG